MSNDMYAVSNIHSGEKDIKVGEKVTGFGKEQLDSWKAQGIVASKTRLRVLRPELFDDETDEGPSEEELVQSLQDKGYKVQAPEPPKQEAKT
jgi:hypothetical protein